MVFCGKKVDVLRQIGCVNFWYGDFEEIDPKCQRLTADQNSGMRGFLECLEESRKIARLEPIKTGAHRPLPWHTDNAKIGRVYVGDQFGA